MYIGAINSLAPVKFDWNFKYVIFKRFLGIDVWGLLWNYPNMNVTGLHWWSVNIGSCNGLVPSGNKPLPKPMLTRSMSPHASLGPNDLNLYCFLAEEAPRQAELHEASAGYYSCDAQCAGRLAGGGSGGVQAPQTDTGPRCQLHRPLPLPHVRAAGKTSVSWSC